MDRLSIFPQTRSRLVINRSDYLSTCKNSQYSVSIRGFQGHGLLRRRLTIGQPPIARAEDEMSIDESSSTQQL